MCVMLSRVKLIEVLQLQLGWGWDVPEYLAHCSEGDWKVQYLRAQVLRLVTWQLPGYPTQGTYLTLTTPQLLQVAGT